MTFWQAGMPGTRGDVQSHLTPPPPSYMALCHSGWLFWLLLLSVCLPIPSAFLPTISSRPFIATLKLGSACVQNVNIFIRMGSTLHFQIDLCVSGGGIPPALAKLQNSIESLPSWNGHRTDKAAHRSVSIREKKDGSSASSRSFIVGRRPNQSVFFSLLSKYQFLGIMNPQLIRLVVLLYRLGGGGGREL